MLTPHQIAFLTFNLNVVKAAYKFRNNLPPTLRADAEKTGQIKAGVYILGFTPFAPDKPLVYYNNATKLSTIAQDVASSGLYPGAIAIVRQDPPERDQIAPIKLYMITATGRLIIWRALPAEIEPGKYTLVDTDDYDDTFDFQKPKASVHHLDATEQKAVGHLLEIQNAIYEIHMRHAP